ncbi:hypothetical protein [Blastopirellula marina]|uniref:DUF481 domain-containing protein n=1 Tax=Blastopirellula marina DSM 3645 TaxID=314230 RepID=A3ZU09_9BACT|nr:hypothetical protein [Blastopirellula marina]EAQ80071.1 hypothetical protein DSM3645_05595 [Blastopirellula marina DSM 3645]
MYLRFTSILTLLLLLSTQANGSEITVLLESGRSLTGSVSSKSDDSQLWLATGNSGVRIVRPIDWDRIQSASVAGATISSDQLRQQQMDLIDPEIRLRSEIVARPVQQASYETEETYVPRLSSLHVSATLENWDYDIIADGLLLTIDARDQFGRSLDLQGQYDAELYAFRRHDFYTAPSQRGVVSTRLGRWGGKLESSGGTAAVRLPYQGLNPETDDTLSPNGLVKVRIIVPGQGVFERKLDWVRIRTYSPYRDYLDLNQGSNLPYQRR